MNNKSFYNSFAKDYNLMIPLQNQIESKMKFFKNFINNSIKTAADLGAGSGADSISLAKLGLKVHALEPSDEMVKQARKNFDDFGVNAIIENKKISEIDESFNGKFDFVVSLGNTFANIPSDEIELSLNKMIDLICTGRKGLIQLLNYDKILSEKERIVSITEGNNKHFIRFYDFETDKVNFNILSYNKDNFSDQQIITTEIFPYRKSDFEKMLRNQKLSNVQFYGDNKLNSFKEESSSNLIILIEK